MCLLDGKITTSRYLLAFFCCFSSHCTNATDAKCITLQSDDFRWLLVLPCEQVSIVLTLHGSKTGKTSKVMLENEKCQELTQSTSTFPQGMVISIMIPLDLFTSLPLPVFIHCYYLQLVLLLPLLSPFVKINKYLQWFFLLVLLVTVPLFLLHAFIAATKMKMSRGCTRTSEPYAVQNVRILFWHMGITWWRVCCCFFYA
jgi:hypothetical protein